MDVGAVLDLDIFKHGLCQPPKLALDIVLGNLRQRAAKMTLFKVVGDAAELGDLVHISVLKPKLVICIRSDRMRQRREKKKRCVPGRTRQCGQYQLPFGTVMMAGLKHCMW